MLISGDCFCAVVIIRNPTNPANLSLGAVTFLVLPTVTTTIFKIFPCDVLDNGKEYLHADYSLSCDSKDASHKMWVAYGVAMILVYPVGVLCLYVRERTERRVRAKQAPSGVT